MDAQLMRELEELGAILVCLCAGRGLVLIV